MIAGPNPDREIKVSVDSKPTADGASGISINSDNELTTKVTNDVIDKTEVNIYEDSFSPYEDPIINEKYSVGPDKTLYQGFEEEIPKIRSINNKLEKSVVGESVTDVSTESTLTSPTTTESNASK